MLYTQTHTLLIIATTNTELESYKAAVIAVCLIILILACLLVAALVKIKKSKLGHKVMVNIIFNILYYTATSCRVCREEKLETDVNVAYCTQKEILALTNTRTV